MPSSQSTVTLQNIIDNVDTDPLLKAITTFGGRVSNKVYAAANDTMQAICDTVSPWKWNEANTPFFYSNSWQQDYALVYPNGLSVTNLSWLTDGIAIQINNSSTPKPWSWIEVGRRQGRSTATILSNSFFGFPQFTCSFLPNNLLYYATWGDSQTGNPTYGNNPQPLMPISNPLGNGNSQPNNPCVQIQDANGNYLLATGYGVTGSSAPLAAPNATPGSTVLDGSVKWTVLDPYGQGIRVKPIPSQTGCVWQFNLVYQMKPVRFGLPGGLGMSQTLFPLPDDYESVFRTGFKANLLQYAGELKVRQMFNQEWTRWTTTLQPLSLQNSKQKSDRERDEDRFIPASSIMGAGSPRVGYFGSGYPFGPIIG